jgi:hypothetical protein
MDWLVAFAWLARIVVVVCIGFLVYLLATGQGWRD